MGSSTDRGSCAAPAPSVRSTRPSSSRSASCCAPTRSATLTPGTRSCRTLRWFATCTGSSATWRRRPST
ncbi:hypothetical protein ACFPRL_29795 [Pseudoclavibacter helvolus]